MMILFREFSQNTHWRPCWWNSPLQTFCIQMQNWTCKSRPHLHFAPCLSPSLTNWPSSFLLSALQSAPSDSGHQQKAQKSAANWAGRPGGGAPACSSLPFFCSSCPASLFPNLWFTQSCADSSVLGCILKGGVKWDVQKAAFVVKICYVPTSFYASLWGGFVTIF